MHTCARVPHRSLSLAAAACVTAWLAGCGPNDERYEGRADGCSGGLSSMTVMLLLDGPVALNPTGYFGQEYSGGRNTWRVAALQDGMNNGRRLSFEVRFDDGVTSSSRWEMDLTRDGLNAYSGTADIYAQNGRTYRCDVELTPERAP